MSVGICVCVCAPVWLRRPTLGIIPSDLLPHLGGRVPLSTPIMLDFLLACPGDPVSAFWAWNFRRPPPPHSICVVLGNLSSSLPLYSKYFNHWATSLESETIYNGQMIRQSKEKNQRLFSKYGLKHLYQCRRFLLCKLPEEKGVTDSSCCPDTA